MSTCFRYVLTFLGVLVVTLNAVGTRGEITNWQTGQTIPGTENIAPEPDIDLSQWNSDSHNLRYGDFSGGLDLTRSRFDESWLDNAIFDQANLTSARLIESTLVNASLVSGNLTDAYLGGADLRNTNFSGANLTRAGLAGSLLENGNLSGADLTEANLTGADLTNADLSGAKLTGIRLRIQGLA